MLESFKSFLEKEDKSKNTIENYLLSVKQFLIWFDQSKGTEFQKLHDENAKEFFSYLLTVKQLKPKSINAKVNALLKFNVFLVESGIQKEIVIDKNNYVKVQNEFLSLSTLDQKEVERLRQMVLEEKSKRNYAIITLLAYCGLRISEVLSIKMNEFNLQTKEILIKGKGDKYRTVYLNDKGIYALRAWLKERKEKNIDNEYLFVSNRNKKIDRTTMNRFFNEYSRKMKKEITPHDLRHFFCSHAIEKGFSLIEVANLAGHSNINTTMQYTHPSREKMKERINTL
ncbi:transposase [Bacillus badius]|nr:transposase [Bacillus badius]